MRFVRTFSLALVLVVALAGLLGASSASGATSLCSTNTNPCAGTNYGIGTTIDTQTVNPGGKPVLRAGFAEVTCTRSELVFKYEDAGGGNPTGNISALTFENCSCETNVVANGSLEITTEAGSANGNGTVIGKGTEITYNCSGVKCKFGTLATGTNLGLLKGGNPALAKISANLSWLAGTGDSGNFVCALGTGLGTFTAEYEVTLPNPLFVE